VERGEARLIEQENYKREAKAAVGRNKERKMSLEFHRQGVGRRRGKQRDPITLGRRKGTREEGGVTTRRGRGKK